MGNVPYDENSNWSREDQRAMDHMCPLVKRLKLSRGLRNMNPENGAWEGPVTGNYLSDYATFGVKADLKGSGLLLNADHKFGVAVYTDDGGVDLNVPDSVRGIQSRTLLTTSHTGCTVRALQGQLKVVTGKSVGTGVYTASQAYVELVGTLTVAANATFSCLNASLELGGVLTVASGGFACGIHVETTGAGTITNGGTCAGILVSNASGAADWPVGIDLTDSCTTGIDIGACTTGISFTGAVTTGISFTGNATDGIKISGGTVVDAIEIGACTYAVNVSGATTDAVRIAGDAVYGIDITNGCSPTAGFLMAGAGAYAIDVTGVQTTMVMRANSQTKPLYQGGTTITLSGASVNAYEINATSAANAAYTLTGLAVTTIPSTADQATSSLTGIYSEVRSTFNVAALRAVTGYINCSAAKAIASESSAVFGDVNVDNATTQTAGRLSAVHAKVRGDSALTGLLDVMHVDAEMSVDTGIYMNVDTSMTATVGIALAGAGTYTTGISMTATAIVTGISIGAATTAIAIAAQTTAGITFAGGASYNPIHIGTKSDSADAGLILTGVTNDTGGIMVFCDDGGDALGSVTSPIWTRYLLTVAQGAGGPTATGMFPQLKTEGSITCTTGSYTALKAYNQAGTVTLVTSAEYGVINAGVTLAGTMAVGAGCTFSGVDVNIGGAGTVSNSGTAAGVIVRSKGEGAVWPVGLYVPTGATRTPIRIGTWISNTASIGHVLASLAEDNVSPGSGAYASAAVGVYCDDGGAAVTNITTPIYSRYLLTVDQSGGGTQTALYAQLKSAGTGTRTYNTGGIRGAYIFTQLAATTLSGTAELVTINAATSLAGTLTVGSTAKWAGVDINLAGSQTITVTTGGIAAGLMIRVASGTSRWPYGLYIPAGSATYPIYAAATQASATPGTVRTIHGVATTFSTMTSGNLVGVRGEINMAGACSATAYLYGAQGKAITGANTFSGTSLAGLYGQIDVTGGTISSGHVAAIQANIYGANAGSIPMEGIYVEHAGGGVINSFIQMFGKTDYVFDIASNTHTNVSSTGTPGACTGATGWIKVLVEGEVRYIPLADSVS